MKRLKQIAVELNVGMKTVTEYCSYLQIAVSSENMKVDNEKESKIIDLHQSKIKIPKPFVKSNQIPLASVETPSEFFQTNPFELDQLKVLKESHKFDGRVPKTIHLGGKLINTIFSDFESHAVCAGLNIPKAKQLARKFFKLGNATDAELYDAHLFANLALEKYGPRLLAHVITLPPLPFKAINAVQIFAEIDMRRKKHEFPTLRLAFNDGSGMAQRLSISYYAVKEEGKRTKNLAVLSVTNKTTGLAIMKITRDGKVLPFSKARSIVPIIELFIRFSNDVKSGLLNYGLETGECAICGRELTDSTSIKIGMGPICRKEYVE